MDLKYTKIFGIFIFAIAKIQKNAYANYFSAAKQVGLKYFCDYRILVVSF